MYFLKGAAGKKVRPNVRIVFIFPRQNTHFKSADMYYVHCSTSYIILITNVLFGKCAAALIYRIDMNTKIFSNMIQKNSSLHLEIILYLGIEK